MSGLQQKLQSGSVVHSQASFPNFVVSYNIDGPLDLSILARCLNEIVRRHQLLYSAFAEEGKYPSTISANPIFPDLKVVDLEALTEEQRSIEANRLAVELTRYSFDVTRSFLVTSRLLRLQAHKHVLLFAAHQSIWDDHSFRILMNEMALLYGAFIRGEANPLTARSVGFAAVLKDQSRLNPTRRETPILESVRLELPTDKQRPASRTFETACLTFQLPAHLTRSFRTLCNNDQRFSSVILTAVQVLLHRYTGQMDLVVGTPVANRDRPETQGLIGPLGGTLLVRTNLTGDPTFTELWNRVHHSIESRETEIVVFDRSVAEEGASQPFPQVHFCFEKREGAIAGPLRIGMSTVGTGTSEIELSFSLIEEHDALTVGIEYSVELWEPPSISRMAGHLSTLLEGVIVSPSIPISTLPLLTEGEQRQILNWNDTSAEFPRDRCLHQLFEAQAAKHPTVLAVSAVATGEQITYGELNRRANRLARQLLLLGVGPDVPVGVCLERSLNWVIAILAVLKSGGTYVPLDSSYPKERLRLMLEDLQVPVLLTQESLRAQLPTTQAKVHYLGSEEHDSSAGDDDNPVCSATPEHLAYIIYTSGSTGTPKGIAVRHRGSLNNIVDLNRSFNLGTTDRVMTVSSPSFDMSIYEVLGLLAAGGAIFIPDPAMIRDPTYLAQLLVDHQITIWNSAPALLKAVVDELTDRLQLRPVRVRLAILGGDWIPVTLPDRLKALATGVQFIALGGATEASIHSTVYPVEQSDPTWRSIPYGRPMANQSAFILDAHCQLVPVGVIGDLYLGGIGLARGYFNRPELTAEKFIPHPFGHEPGARLYRTGDLARYFPDGTIEFLGRIDHQVKIRGFRIEPGEIEAVLRLHPAVRESTVVAQPGPSGQKRLVAFVVAHHDRESSVDVELDTSKRTALAEDLQKLLQDRLPEYMVPSVIVPLDAMPLSPNGKVDKSKLMSQSVAHAAEPPGNYWEAQLARIWEEVLNTPSIGINTNLFRELGADSLTTARAAGKVRTLLRKDIHPIRFLQRNTIKEQAKLLLEVDDTNRSALVTIAPGSSAPPLFLVHGAGGSAFPYVKLAHYLGAQRPIFAFQDPHVEGGKGFTSIEETADRFLADLRSTTKGPFFLGGWSFGGTVAFEMANRLLAEGRPILGLIFFDTAAPLGRSKLRIRLKRFFRKSMLRFPRLAEQLPFFREIMSRPLLYRFAALAVIDMDNNDPSVIQLLFPGIFDLHALKQLSADDMWESVYCKLSSLDNSRLFAPGIDANGYRQQANLWGVQTRIEAHYDPQWKYPGKIVLLKRRGDDSSLAWQQYASHPLVIKEYDLVPTDRIPDAHNAMMEDVNVKLFHEDLRVALQELEIRAP